MARFDFKSPGAEFTGTMADLLTKRKAEQRQAMIDQLSVNADMRAQEDSQREAAMQEAQLGSMAQQQELARLGIIRSGLKRGATPTGDNAALLEKWGFLEDLPTPGVSTSTEFTGAEGAQMEGDPTLMEASAPPPPKRRGYVGSPDEQREVEDMAATGSLIQSLLADPKTRAAGERLAQMVAVNRGKGTPEMISKEMPRDVPIKKFDMEAGTISDMGTAPEDAKFITQSRPPVIRPRNLMPALKPDGTLGMIDQESVRVGPDGTVQLPTGWTPIRGSGSGGSNPQAAALGISDGAFRAYTENLDLVELDDNGRATATSMLPAKRIAGQMIANAKVSPAVKDAALKFVQNPDSARDVNLPSEKDALQFRQLMNVIATDPTTIKLFRDTATQPTKPGEMMKNMSAPAPKPQGLIDLITGRAARKQE